MLTKELSTWHCALHSPLNRRTFAQTLAGLGVAAVPSLAELKSRKLQIGYTTLTWNAVPNTPEALEPALKDISDLGFYNFETFSEILVDWDTKGTLRRLIDRYRVPLKSGYCGTNLTDPSLRKDNVAKVVKWGNVIKKYGGTFGVLAPNSVERDKYDFQANRASIVAGLNDYSMALADLGVRSGLHQHTGTCIETRDEVYAVMDAVNTKYMKFAPDVGQLQKGGADAAKVIKDFLPLVEHMHLKDYSGGEYFAGYCPLGQGKVDIAQILDLVEKGGKNPDVMVELDRSPSTPITALQTAQTSKAYLEKLGYRFRT